MLEEAAGVELDRVVLGRGGYTTFQIAKLCVDFEWRFCSASSACPPVWGEFYLNDRVDGNPRRTFFLALRECDAGALLLSGMVYARDRDFTAKHPPTLHHRSVPSPFATRGQMRPEIIRT